ncbi:MAG: diadenylate cyclase CdaA [Clostridia bacterium]|nr:diadenylate cyclase CdaA [Clostridia bacterium]
MNTITSFQDLISYIVAVLSGIRVVDVIDIVIVTFLLYYVYRFIRERRAGKLAIGVILLILFMLVSEVTNMYAMSFIMENLFQVGIIALIIVFQPELRTALEKFGAEPLKTFKLGDRQNKLGDAHDLISSLCSAVCDMSLEKTGALIVLERSTRLGDIIRTGTVIDAKADPFLIKNIFFNKAPLHDGAMVIRDGRICAAGCFLPLSGNPEIIKDLGTRHRAGIGMSEDSDAVVIIVSEETGTISSAVDGKLTSNYSYQSLKTFLEGELITESDETGRKKQFRDILHMSQKDKKNTNEIKKDTGKK